MGVRGATPSTNARRTPTGSLSRSQRDTWTTARALPGSGAPRSLGLISASGSTVLMRDRVTPDTTALAVSLEPTGGSPTGAPTGPVLFVGKLQI